MGYREISWGGALSGSPERPDSPLRSASPPGSLLWTPPAVSLQGIPNPVSAPRPNPATFRRVKIPKGSRGTTATLKIMADLAREAASDPYFIMEARGIVRGNGSKNYEQDARSIMDFVKTRIDYRPDPQADGMVDWVQSPGWTLYVDGQGDCDDSSTLLAALDLAAGLGASFRAVRLNRADPSSFSHVYTMAGWRDSRTGRVVWAAQDTVPDPVLGWEPPAEEQVGPPNDELVGWP